MGDKIENNLEEEIKIESEEIGIKEVSGKKIESEKLVAEIKVEEENRKLNKDNIENFKKSQKPKKSLKKKVLAWVLGASIFTGTAVGGLTYYHNNYSEEAYNNEIKSKYEVVDKTLTTRLYEDTQFDSFKNGKITHMRIEDPIDSEAEIKIYYEGMAGQNNTWQGCAIFDIMLNYYNALVEAEASNNMLYYLDALNEVFSNMQIIHDYSFPKVDFFNYDEVIGDTAENHKKANELFALDIEVPGVVKQIGFLPYSIEVLKYEVDREKNVENYTYKISGISFCETVEASSDKIPNTSEDFILEKDYDKNKVKAFFRDFTFSSSWSRETLISNSQMRLFGDINCHILNIKEEPITIETTYFKETTIFEEFNEMKDGEFNYKKPNGFNLKDYKEANK